jgi:hypothetical protein
MARREPGQTEINRMTSVANYGCSGNKNHKRRIDPLMVYDGQFGVGEIRSRSRERRCSPH